MASANESSSSSSATHDFPCCCGLAREEFQYTGTTAALIFNSILLVLTSVSATLGNLLVLVSIWRTPSQLSPSNVLIVGLAVSDLGVGLILEPLTFVHMIAQYVGSVRVFCNAAVALRFAGALLVCASLLSMTAISVDMYLALYLHLRYQELVTVTRMVRVLFAVWVCSATAGLFNIWYKDHLGSCWASLTLLCLLVTTTAYVKVFRIVRHHQEQIHAQQQVQEQAADHEDSTAINFAQQKKSSITKFLLYCLLVVCHLPLSVMKAVSSYKDPSSHVRSIYYMSHVLVYFNSALNPFIYCWRFQNIRSAVIDTVKKMVRPQTLSPQGNQVNNNNNYEE